LALGTPCSPGTAHLVTAATRLETCKDKENCQGINQIGNIGYPAINWLQSHPFTKPQSPQSRTTGTWTVRRYKCWCRLLHPSHPSHEGTLTLVRARRGAHPTHTPNMLVLVQAPQSPQSLYILEVLVLVPTVKGFPPQPRRLLRAQPRE
jgi:hypothetical protein